MKGDSFHQRPLVRPRKGVRGIEFVKSLRSLPRKPSFWLDDWFFWFPIMKDACKMEEVPQGTSILVTDENVFNPIEYDEATLTVRVPLPGACELHNQYVKQLKIKPTASTAAECTVNELFTLFDLYDGMGTDVKPWIEDVLLESTLRFKFNSLIDFVAHRLDRNNTSAGAFLDALLRHARTARYLSAAKRRGLLAAIGQEPSGVPVSGIARMRMERPPQRYDVFLSHASEDKDAIARPLYAALRAQGVSVWFDEAVLELGDSLRQRIDDGLARCRFGVVILSPRFFAKKWPRRELDGLVARETSDGRKAILPIWHELTRQHVVRYSPPLADRVAGRSDEGVPRLVVKIVQILGKRPNGQRSTRNRPRPNPRMEPARTGSRKRAAHSHR